MKRVLLTLATTALLTLGQRAHAAADPAVSTATGRAVVVSGHRLATEAGLAVLRRGGNAVDTAVAVSLTLGVAEPYGSGLGGGLVLLYHDARTGQTTCIDALSAAPHSLNTDAFCNLDKDARDRGYQSVAVPGLLAGLSLAHERWGGGRLKWADLVAPAVAVAEAGFTVESQAVGVWKLGKARLTTDPETARLYTIDGRLPAVGDRLTNPDLARSLRLVAKQGANALYGGELGRRLADASKLNGSPITLEDLRRYRPRAVEPLAADYRGHRIASSPPPLVGGATVLLALRALERQPIDTSDPFAPDHLDAVGRTLRAVYPAVAAKTGDASSSRPDAAALLADAGVAKIIQLAAAPDAELAPVGADGNEERPGSGETTHFVVVDAKGNVVSATQTLSARFGAGVVAPGAGFLLNNSLTNFAVRTPTSVNYAAPGKRPRSTMSPTIVLDEQGQPVMAVGLPGAQRIPTAVLQTLIRTIDLKLPLDQAIALPRWHVLRAITGTDLVNQLDLEAEADTALDAELHRLGWQVKRFERSQYHFGGINGATRQADGRWTAVGDLRRTNYAGALP